MEGGVSEKGFFHQQQDLNHSQNVIDFFLQQGRHKKVLGDLIIIFGVTLTIIFGVMLIRKPVSENTLKEGPLKIRWRREGWFPEYDLDHS